MEDDMDNNRKQWNDEGGDGMTNAGGQMGDETQNPGQETQNMGGGMGSSFQEDDDTEIDR
jgi:hypothetical protein